ncbi:hypothetical protein [Paraliomyxa miuraensis]|uniref:hypothetical protein n=1 Tax=Paraliomyxa miuraensis TaxID=376150 RepID=UPI00225C3861|nr:hypothetical protein [Paraliomyxa miuraensis]MCX4242052.1 hypothetical protein [Paraliomyxa miuraensis]
MSIIESTRRFMADLDLDTLRAAEVSAKEHSRHSLGAELSLRDLLELLVAAKVVAAGDDFVRGEAQGLRMWLTRHAMPMAVQQYLLDVDVGHWRFEDLGSRLTAPASLEARRLLWLVAMLASFEGLRRTARTRIETLGARLGLPPCVVQVMIEEAQITVSALLRGDDPLLRRLIQLRGAIFSLETAAATGS